MVNPLIGKNFSSMKELKINKQVEREGKKAKRQSGFRPKHCIINHNVNLRILIEKILNIQGDEAFFYFIDFKKSFDRITCDKLWDRMEELEVPNELRVAIHRLYEQVKAKIITLNGMFECFGNDTGVTAQFILISQKND